MESLRKIKYLELKRKIAHVLFGIVGLILLMYHLVDPLIIFIILIIGSLASLLSLRIKIPILSWFLGQFEREKEMREFPGRGIIFAVAGSLLALRLFPENIALASIAILTFADPLSYVVGKTLGKTRSFFDKRKNIEGHIAGALVSSLFAMFFVPFYLAFSGAVIAMLFESIIIEIQKVEIDDNLIIPLVAGTTMLLLQLLLKLVI